MIVFDDMIIQMLSNKKRNPVVTELWKEWKEKWKERKELMFL